MNIETCYQYTRFLIHECTRYLEDRAISETEIAQLKIELDRFIKKTSGSDLPDQLKSAVARLELNYEFRLRSDNRDLLGKWDFGKYRRHQTFKRNVERFKLQLADLLSFLETNYLK